MANFKATLLINQGLAGWSESFYLAADSVNDARLIVMDVIKLRNNCFGTDPAGETPGIAFFRITNVVGSNSQLFANNVDFKPNIFFEAPDMPWTAVTNTLIASNGSKRQLTIRGVPDIPIVAPFQRPIQGDLRAQIRLYLDRFVNSELRMRTIAKGGVSGLKQIANIAANANGSLRVTSVLPHGFTEPGEHAYFYHVKCQRVRIVGIHLVVPVTETTFDLPTFNVSQVGFESGEFRIYGVEYVGITQAIMGRKTKHNTGRPFSPLRGRQPARKH